MNQEAHPYHCSTISTGVTLFIQTFDISAVGREAPTKQHDFDCSLANTCPQRYTNVCPVQKLNL